MAAIEEPIAPAAEVNSGAGGKSKKAKESKAKKTSAPKKSKNVPSHPTYFEMVSVAITTLKERNGSSQYAIQKFVEEKYKQLPANFRKLLLVSLRKFVASGRLVKVKGSFKLPAGVSSAPKAVSAPAKKPKAAIAAKPKAKATATKPKGKAAPVKAKTATKPKAAAKAKAPVKTKPAVAQAKAKAAGTKRKAVSDVKDKPVKVAKTVAKATPAKKTAAVKPAKKAAPAKKAPVKSVKPKSVKSPAKRAMPKRGKK